MSPGGGAGFACLFLVGAGDAGYGRRTGRLWSGGETKPPFTMGFGVSPNLTCVRCGVNLNLRAIGRQNPSPSELCTRYHGVFSCSFICYFLQGAFVRVPPCSGSKRFGQTFTGRAVGGPGIFCTPTVPLELLEEAAVRRGRTATVYKHLFCYYSCSCHGALCDAFDLVAPGASTTKPPRAPAVIILKVFVSCIWSCVSERQLVAP